MTRDEEIEKTLDSLDGLTSAQMSSALSEKILSRSFRRTQKLFIETKIIWRVAASILILFFINFYTCYHHSKNFMNNNKGEFISDYFNYMQNIQL